MDGGFFGFANQCTVKPGSQSRAEVFVVSVAKCPSTATVAVGHSTGQLTFVDLCHFSPKQSLATAHQGSVTRLATCASEPNVLASISLDGSSKLWDLRSQTEAASVRLSRKTREAETWCVSLGGSDGKLWACCVDSKVIVYDVRNPSKAFLDLSDVHSNTVSYVGFHPTQQHILVSGADDNLVCAFDCNAPVDDEFSILGTLSVDDNVRDVAFCGPRKDIVAVATTTDVLSAWECEFLSGTVYRGDMAVVEQFINAPGRFGVRQVFNSAAIRCSESLQVDGSSGSVVAVFGTETEHTLTMGTSSNGDVELFGMSNETEIVQPFVRAEGQGHTGLVRSGVPVNEDGSCYVTGAEDGKLCLWKKGTGTSPNKTKKKRGLLMTQEPNPWQDESTMSDESPVKRPKPEVS